MYRDIEREYKKINPEEKFNRYYWKWSLVVGSLYILFYSLIPSVRPFSFLIYIIIFALAILYYVKDINEALKTEGRKKKFSEKLNLYKEHQQQNTRANLLTLLMKHNIKSKSNIKLIIDYYNAKRPIAIQSSPLGWFLSLVIALASFIEIAYDSQTSSIDYTKISIIFSSAIGMCIVSGMIVIFIKIAINSVILQKKRVYSELEEDLTYIFLNFDKFKKSMISS